MGDLEVRLRLSSLILISSLLTACTGKSDDTGTCDSPGGPADGTPDAHCTAADYVTVDPTDCQTATDTGGMADYGDTMYGYSGDDDDCKYAVTWSSTDICEGTGVTFTVNVNYLADGTATTGADPQIEGYLTSDTTHVLPNSGVQTTEVGGGQYTVGPIDFDASGEWTVRFHFFETCADTETGPHGHAAFAVDVP